MRVKGYENMDMRIWENWNMGIGKMGKWENGNGKWEMGFGIRENGKWENGNWE